MQGGFDSHPRALIHHYRPRPGDDGYGYWRELADWWVSPDTIINVEWDMEYTPALAAELLRCPRSLCSHAYRMWTPYEYYAHSHNADGQGGHWISKGEEWAAYSAIGFCKIEAHVRIGELERSPWRAVEQAVNRAVRGPWHIHWDEIGHYHTKEEQRIERKYH